MARVLVVDDEAGIREVLRGFLSAGGHEVWAAASLDEALAVVSHEEVDVVVSDIVMPGRDGLELVGVVRELAPEVKVILFTGLPSYESAAEAVRQGAFEYLTKPVSRATLLRSVEAAANVKALEDEARRYRHELERMVSERNDRLSSWNRRLHHLADRARTLGASCQLPGAAPEILATLARSTLADGGSFYLRREGHLELVAAHQAPHAAARIGLPPTSGSVVARMLSDAQAVLVTDVTREWGTSSPAPESYRDGSFIGLSCRGASGQVEALIFLYNRRQGVFSEQDLAIGQIVAARVEDSLRMATLLDAARQAEDRRQDSRAQLLVEQADQIFRTVRHEIGNALNTLKTTLSVLRKNVASFDDAKREEYFARCFESFRLAEQMLHALRAFQRFDQVEPVRLEVCRFLCEKEGFLFSAARSRGVVCCLDTEAGVEVLADPDALLRVLLNLVDNAVAATAERPEPAIRIGCSRSGREVTVRVEDNGIGIPPEHRDRVFEPLFSTKAEGSGMGLAIVQRLVAKMGGSVRLDSTPGAGTRVEVALPVLTGSGDALPRVEAGTVGDTAG
ncbi:MAG TPA: ATP-binding protein [Thermoanaerobaculaceae bacterium]|nr:ATP-binding protein [Thermoanaerobaculaceae bacterium]HRS16057.1 ATP-binding protein [Thermoanaerobaculaceae bacterium]